MRCSCSSSCAWPSSSSAGHVWRAIRENEPRVEVLGLSPYPFKLIAFVLAAFLAVLGGVVWLLLIGGATPEVTTANFTLALLVMVVLGGAGTRFGAMIGGFLYTLLDQRLGALSSSSHVQDLPDVLRVPLSEPLFLLGTLFILLVFFVPGGIASLPAATPRAPHAARAAARGGRRRDGSPGSGAGAATPLLLIHGLGYARWGWEPVLPSLAERFDVILFDNRGIGESDAPPGPYTAAEMAADAVQVLDEAGVERAHVVGTSLGGMVAQELALSSPSVSSGSCWPARRPAGEGAPDAAGRRSR